MARIELNEVRKQFGAVKVIKGVDLDIEDREFVVFVGPSGCGKSTMLRLIAGLEEASSGAIVIDGDDVTALSASERQLSMVFQSYALYPHMTVAQNLAFGLKMAGRPAGEITEKVGRAADILQLGLLMERQPKELSGGQRQRVAIGRSIVRDPRAFLFDEPLSNLDASLRVQMRIEIARLHNRLAATMIYVTHDQVEAMTLADRIVVFSGGTIEQVGVPIDLYRNPSNLFVATFIGSPQMNILDCGPANGSAKEVHLGSGDAVSVGTAVSEAAPAAKFGIRPEHIELSADGGGHVSGSVGVSERLGSDSFLYVDVDGVGTITVRVSGEQDIAVGETISLRFQETQVHLFDGDGKALTSR